MRSVWLAALSVALVLTGAPAQAACTVGKLDLPVTMAAMRALVDAKFNGHDGKLIVDSGAFYSTISQASAKQYGLFLHDAPPRLFISGVGGAADVQATTVDTFTLAGVDIRRVEFLVGGSDTGQVGLLGRNILAFADTEYDLGEGMIRFIRPKGCGGVNLAYWAAGRPLTVLPMLNDGYVLPAATIGIRVNGAYVRAVLDSGAAQSTMTRTAARRAGIDVMAAGSEPVGMSSGIGRRAVPTWRVKVAKIDLDGEAIDNVKLFVSDTDLGETDMLLGADFFLSHRILISYSQRKVYLTYQGGPVFDASEHPRLAAANQAMEAIADPTDADGFSRRGAAYAERGDADRAMADFDKAIALDPKSPRYRLQRAAARLRAKRPILAMDDIDAALALAPGDPDALIARAELRLKGDDHAGAEADLAAAAKVAPAEGGARLAIAALYTELDDFGPAVAAYDLWIADHPDDVRLGSALNGRCWARALGNVALDRALSDCNRAVGLGRGAAAFLDSRGLVRLRRGEYARAIADYDAALKLDPKIAWSLYGRGLAELATGQAAAGHADIAAGEALQPKLEARARKLGLAPPADEAKAASAQAAPQPPPPKP